MSKTLSLVSLVLLAAHLGGCSRLHRSAPLRTPVAATASCAQPSKCGCTTSTCASCESCGCASYKFLALHKYSLVDAPQQDRCPFTPGSGKVTGPSEPVKVNVLHPSIPTAHNGRHGQLTPEEMRIARAAWSYFENNYQPTTGMVNASDKYPSTTLWDQASYVAALVSAFELEIIDKANFDHRVLTLWTTMQKLSLFGGELPNKAYNTMTAQAVDYANKPGEIGWSAIDISRWLIWSQILKERYPEFSNLVDQTVLRWKYCDVVRGGELFGAVKDASQPNGRMLVQEGRLGYEQYAAKGFALWGFNTTVAATAKPLEYIDIYGVKIPYDSRDPRQFGAHNYIVVENYVLDGIEFGWRQPYDRDNVDETATDAWAANMANLLYQVHERRYDATGLLSARSEHQLDTAPYFVYDTVYADGYPWNTITDKGVYVPGSAAVSAKGAMGLWTLYETPYTDLLFRTVNSLAIDKEGIYEGLYENGRGPVKVYTANNNGIILSALLYKVQGRLLKWSGNASLWDHTVQKTYGVNANCLPRSTCCSCSSSSSWSTVP